MRLSCGIHQHHAKTSKPNHNKTSRGENINSDFYLYNTANKTWFLICPDTAQVGAPPVFNRRGQADDQRVWRLDLGTEKREDDFQLEKSYQWQHAELEIVQTDPLAAIQHL
ncbi:hypothetical protein quinque_009951 [Culex quinquefasciatus]